MSDDRAKRRFFAMQAARIGGIGGVVVGLLIARQRIGWLEGVPPWVGYLLVGIGLVDAFVVPPLLARRWRSPPP